MKQNSRRHRHPIPHKKYAANHYYQKKLTFSGSSAQATAGSDISTTVDDTIGQLLLLAVPLRLPYQHVLLL